MTTDKDSVAGSEQSDARGGQGSPETRENLLEAARDTIRDIGVTRLSVNSVITRAGTSHGTFYLYFANKDAMLAALIAECQDTFDALALELPELKDSDEAFHAFDRWVVSFLEAFTAQEPAIRAHFAVQNDGSPLDGLVEHLRTQLVTRGMTDDDQDAEVLARLAIAALSVFGTTNVQPLDGPARRTASRFVHRGLLGPLDGSA